MSLSNGVLSTQREVERAVRRRRAAEIELDAAKRDLAEAEERHRRRIALSMRSKDEEEASMAKSVAGWWEVEA